MTLGFSHNSKPSVAEETPSAKRLKTSRATAERSHTFFGCRTDTGSLREKNEDSLIAQDPLFIVADGMGGHAGGEIASEIAVRTIAECAPSTPDAEALGRAVDVANREVINATLEDSRREGMGTTCTAAIVEGTHLVIAQVGDSRAYLLHAGSLSQITRDHSVVADLLEIGYITEEQARFHPSRSKITRALGSDINMQPDLYELTIAPGDRLLLCTDGLVGMVSDAIICEIMMTYPDAQMCADKLVEAALTAGGLDNVTVIVVNADRPRSAKKQRIPQGIITLAIGIVFALAICVALVVWASQ